MDFLAAYEEDRKLVLSVALEGGLIKRILVGWVGPDDSEDTIRTLDEESLAKALESKGDDFKLFFESITSA